MTVSAKAKTAQQARSKARERRLMALDADRAARDERIEAAAAVVFLRVDDRARAKVAVTEAEDGIGAALRLVLAEGVTVEQAAELCELKVAEARRLVRLRAGNREPATG